MIRNTTKERQLWNGLGETWKAVLADHLELSGCFEQQDLAYLQTIKDLDVCGHPIADLGPCQHMPMLESIDISETLVQDVSPLKGLPRLKFLDASFCIGLDLESLEGLTQLEVLDISYPKHAHQNLGALSKLSGLQELYCNSCELDDLSLLPTSGQLEVLCLFFNPLDREAVRAFEREHPACRVLL